MEIWVELLDKLPGVIGASFTGILMISWLAPNFLEFLRDILGGNHDNYRRLEERIMQLESQLEDSKQMELSAEK